VRTGATGLAQRTYNAQGEPELANSSTTLIGNLTSDPEMRFMDNGSAKLEFSIACNYNYKDASDEWQTKTSYFDCVAWRRDAEDLANVLEKGVGVIATGRLEQRSWEDKEGNKRSKVELVVDNCGIQARNIESFERKRAAEGNGTGNASAQRRPAATRQASRRQPALNEEPF
jgi:single-strand DNA-binding protein